MTDKTDRELLELAAKAAGIKLLPGAPAWHRWNPLIDDSDEARLEAQLGIDITWSISRVSAQHRLGLIFVTETFDDHNGDKQKARRYAGTRAAAEIAKGLP